MKLLYWALGLSLAAGPAAAADGPGPSSPTATHALSATAMASVPTAPLTLADCYRAALKQSESLATQGEAVAQAAEYYRQARGSILPNLSTSAAYLHQDPNGLGGAVAAVSPADQTTTKLSAAWPLFRGMREYAALRATRDHITAAKQAYQWAALQLGADTAQAYYLVLAQQRDLANLQNQFQLYDQRINDLRYRVGIGRSQTTDLLSVQSAQARLKSQIDAARYQITAAQELLAFETGLPADALLRDVGDLPARPRPMQGYLDALESRPDLEAARQNLAAAKEGVAIAWGQHLPNVDASADYYFDRPGNLSDVRWDAGIAVTLPLFMGGVVDSQTRVARSQQAQAQLALEQARRMDVQALRDAYRKLVLDLDQATDLQAAVDLAQRDFKAEQHDYNLGLVTNLDVLQALVTFVDTQRSFDSVRYAAFTDDQSLESQAGRTLSPAGDTNEMQP